MPLEEIATGRKLVTLIQPIEMKDFRWITRSKNFGFDWTTEKNNEVYKITTSDQPVEILGLLSLIDVVEEYRIHLNLIESTDKQRGKKKTIANIPGCLIAYACQLAFERGYYGFVSLQPKTRLIDYYQDNYDFRQYGRFLGIEQEPARQLIIKYLYDEEE